MTHQVKLKEIEAPIKRDYPFDDGLCPHCSGRGLFLEWVDGDLDEVCLYCGARYYEERSNAQVPRDRIEGK